MPSTRLPFAILLLAVAIIGGLALADAADGTAATCAPENGSVLNITTEEDVRVTSAGVEVAGDVRVRNTHEFYGWIEYRVAGAGESWSRTNRTTHPTNACGQGWFEAILIDLEANTTYAYRAVAATANETARGAAETVTVTWTPNASSATDTVPSTGTPGRTPTPNPCPEYRGVGSKCTGTPTPPPLTETSPGLGDDNPSRDDLGVDGWFGGLVPLLAWTAAVVVLAPLVLGGLIGVDSLRNRR